MLSATPHDDKASSFASLVNMLDASAIADPDDYTAEDFRPGLVIRRFAGSGLGDATRTPQSVQR